MLFKTLSTIIVVRNVIPVDQAWFTLSICTFSIDSLEGILSIIPKTEKLKGKIVVLFLYTNEKGDY